MLCAIWYHTLQFKNVKKKKKNTHGGVLLLTYSINQKQQSSMIALTWKGQNQIHWIMPISETCSFVLSIEMFSLDISYAYWYACFKELIFF